MVLRSAVVIAKGRSLSKARNTRDLLLLSFAKSGCASAKRFKVSFNCAGSLSGLLRRHNSPSGVL